MILLLLALVAAPAPRWSSMVLDGWTPDGTALVAAPGVDGIEDGAISREYGFLALYAPDGSLQRFFRDEKTVDDNTKTPEGEAAWAAAEPKDAGKQWSNAHPLLDAPANSMIDEGAATPLPAPWSDATARGEASGDKCRSARLVVAIGAVSQALFSDPCPSPRVHLQLWLQAVPSPDGTRLALSFQTVRFDDAGGQPAIRRAWVAVVTRRALASVDLLDAGAGASVEAVAKRAEGGGFHVAHRGKAMAKRDASAVYFAPGFEKEARELAGMLQIDAAAVQAVSWKTQYALTVALSH